MQYYTRLQKIKPKLQTQDEFCKNFQVKSQTEPAAKKAGDAAAAAAVECFKQQLSDMIDEAMFGSEQGDERQTQPKRQCVATESTQPVRT